MGFGWFHHSWHAVLWDTQRVLALKDEMMVSLLSPTGFSAGNPTWVYSGGEWCTSPVAAHTKGTIGNMGDGGRSWMLVQATSHQTEGPAALRGYDGGCFQEMVSLLCLLLVLSSVGHHSSHGCPCQG